jgi:DNA polymerase delta subunit 1
VCLSALEHQLIVPDLPNQGDSGDQYEGATVIEPKRGYYKEPVATLDFASLYPSIMQAHNLCYTTWLDRQTVEKLKMKKDEDYIVTPNGDMFCTSKTRKGLLTEILEELLGCAERSSVGLESQRQLGLRIDGCH